MSIQRWTSWCSDPKREDENGRWVTYADHVAAVAEAEQRVRREGWQAGFDYAWPRGMQAQRDEVTYAETDDAYAKGQRDEREACIAAIAALPCDSYEITVSRQTVLDAIRAREEKP